MNIAKVSAILILVGLAGTAADARKDHYRHSGHHYPHGHAVLHDHGGGRHIPFDHRWSLVKHPESDISLRCNQWTGC
jgi:hypothetical protein